VLEYLATDSHHFRTAVAIIVILMIAMATLVFFQFGRRQRGGQSRYSNSLPLFSDSPTTGSRSSNDGENHASMAHDTVFVVPDISHYTRFITANQQTAARAQEIVFSLINAMIEACDGTFELSKLEGDAMLFFCDARMHSREKIGQTIIAIFDAFAETKSQLVEKEAGFDDGCKNIDDLDLKIFVHRGETARFSFRGTIDHFGADVIILHRLMKNSVEGKRYIMVTDAASDLVSLDGNFDRESVEEDLAESGTIEATVFRIPGPEYAAAQPPIIPKDVLLVLTCNSGSCLK